MAAKTFQVTTEQGEQLTVKSYGTYQELIDGHQSELAAARERPPRGSFVSPAEREREREAAEAAPPVPETLLGRLRQRKESR